MQRPLTLVSAPAGYGKSTLISRWLESMDFGELKEVSFRQGHLCTPAARQIRVGLSSRCRFDLLTTDGGVVTSLTW